MPSSRYCTNYPRNLLVPLSFSWFILLAIRPCPWLFLIGLYKSSILRSRRDKSPPFSAISGSAAAAAKSLQSCPTLCDPINGRPPGCPVPGILQARTLEWVAISFSNAWKWKVKVKSLSRVRLFATPWTAAYQTPQSMGFSRQEYWSGVILPSLVSRSSPLLFCKTTSTRESSWSYKATKDLSTLSTSSMKSLDSVW